MEQILCFIVDTFVIKELFWMNALRNPLRQQDLPPASPHDGQAAIICLTPLQPTFPAFSIFPGRC